MDSSNEQFLARFWGDGEIGQPLREHLNAVADLASNFASKMNLSKQGELIGLLHDLGKYSADFQNYLRSAQGKIDPDSERYLDPKMHKGKIDHSTAGAQLIWKELSEKGEVGKAVGRAMAMAIASHHSGLINEFTYKTDNDNEATFEKRMLKADAKTNRIEACKKLRLDPSVYNRFKKIIVDEDITQSFQNQRKSIEKSTVLEEIKNPKIKVCPQIKKGFLIRFLFSCLVDADRIDSSRSTTSSAPGWNAHIQRLETFLNGFKSDDPIDKIRQQISSTCLDKSSLPQDIYSLSVPTGGGKTLSSLRFALHHAQKHGLERIFFIAPYTSILDQNAQRAREILEDGDEQQRGTVVLEHHSNLSPEAKTSNEEVLAQNWDAPVIFTTLVQFLESLFSAGTQSARRMHRLTRAVIVFDEIQSLPIRCVHLFNNAVNFLVEQGGSTALLCTATQPLLHRVNPVWGALRYDDSKELISHKEELYSQLKRVEVHDFTQGIHKNQANNSTPKQVAQLAFEQAIQANSCLCIVNTKQQAKTIFEECKLLVKGQEENFSVYHLSTDMCPAHRMHCIENIKSQLQNANQETKTICISTQLIEAGIDIDFGSVIRALAGLDSIAQAAGRCNRHGKRPEGNVFLVKIADENLSKLPDIAIGAENTERILSELPQSSEYSKDGLLSPKTMERYYNYHFHNRSKEMVYNIESKDLGVPNLLTLLSKQAFMQVGEFFDVIDTPTQGVLVPYGEEGKNLIIQFCATDPKDLTKLKELRKKAQRLSVNVFRHQLEQLKLMGAVSPVHQDSEVLYLREDFYTSDRGLCFDHESSIETEVPFI